MSEEEECKPCNLKMNEEFVCKVKFKEGALNDLEVLEGDEGRCRQLFQDRPTLKESVRRAGNGEQ